MKSYLYLRMGCASVLIDELILMDGLECDFELDEGGNFETWVSEDDWDEAYVRMKIEYEKLYGISKERKKIFESLSQIVKYIETTK